jgi:hypothetical protein
MHLKPVQGATCHGGSAPTWKHFVPDTLFREPFKVAISWVTVAGPDGTSEHLNCDDQVQGCVPAEAAPMTPQDAVHAWAYDTILSMFVLRSCPPGFQLVNSSSPSDTVFNPKLQMCSGCAVNYYIIDASGPCLKCPKVTPLEMIASTTSHMRFRAHACAFV